LTCFIGVERLPICAEDFLHQQGCTGEVRFDIVNDFGIEDKLHEIALRSREEGWTRNDAMSSSVVM
jgi:hypothetical protein